MTERFVTYARVSTQRQGQSGLSLEAQRHAVAEYLGAHEDGVIAEFVEVESGRKASRPELAKALALCKGHQATLIVAKLDRLARNAAFLLTLKDSGVDFVCADMPEANRFTIGIMAVVAEHESEMISARVKAAIAARTRRGLKWPPRDFTPEARRKGVAAHVAVVQAEARRRAAAVFPVVMELRAAGARSADAIAAGLNARGIPRPRGGVWRRGQVNELLNYLGMAPTLGDALAVIRNALSERGDNRDRNRKIYQAHIGGRTYRSLATEYGLSPSRIQHLCFRERSRRARMGAASCAEAVAGWRRGSNLPDGVSLREVLEDMLDRY